MAQSAAKDGEYDGEDRLTALASLGLVGTGAEERFDRITRAAQELFEVPLDSIAGLVAEHRDPELDCRRRQSTRRGGLAGRRRHGPRRAPGGLGRKLSGAQPGFEYQQVLASAHPRWERRDMFPTGRDSQLNSRIHN